MIKSFYTGIIILASLWVKPPEVKVSGAMKSIMINGDLSAHINLDTLNKAHLYGLGPVAGLKGEIIIADGVIYSSSKNGGKLTNQQNKISQAAMLVYSRVEKWKSISIKVSLNNYAELEKLIENTAKANGYEIEIPFAFKIEASPVSVNYHVIDWKEGSAHSMDNHKQFAYSGQFINEKMIMLGFYSRHHQSIFTHHTTYMHIHILDEKTKTVGHLDDAGLNGPLTIYLPGK
jgi:acetolactate decarboxylase